MAAHSHAFSPQVRHRIVDYHSEVAVRAQLSRVARQILAPRSPSPQRRRRRVQRPRREIRIRALQAQGSLVVSLAPTRCGLYVAIRHRFDRAHPRNDVRPVDWRLRRRLRRVSSAAARILSPSSPVDDRHLVRSDDCHHHHLSVPPRPRYHYRGAFVSSPRRRRLSPLSRVAQSLAPSSAPRAIAGVYEAIHHQTTRARPRR